MNLFFEAKTDEDRKLLEDYDAAVKIFRARVSSAMEDAAGRTPSLREPMLAAAEAMRLRPLPSEANADSGALRLLALASATVEKIFSVIHLDADTAEARAAIADVARCMKEAGRATTGRPEFQPLTGAVLKAVAEVKKDAVRGLEGSGFDAYLGEARKLAQKLKQKAKPDWPPRI